MRIVKTSATLVAATPDATRVCEEAGRTCYKSDPVGDAADFIRKVIARGHESVIEHASATVRLICDRGVSHELVRHRVASYSQESTRYCNYSKGRFGGEIEVIEPADYKKGHPVWDAWEKGCRDSEESYLRMIAAGASAQQARSVLNNSLKTEVVMTCNMREWRHFFKLRLAPAAHPDMRIAAKEIFLALRMDSNLDAFLSDLSKMWVRA